MRAGAPLFACVAGHRRAFVNRRGTRARALPPAHSLSPAAQNETYELCEIMLSLQPKVASSGGKSSDDVIEEVASALLARDIQPFPLDEIVARYPLSYEESMNTVLSQARYARDMPDAMRRDHTARTHTVATLHHLDRLAGVHPLQQADRGFQPVARRSAEGAQGPRLDERRPRGDGHLAVHKPGEI